MNKFNPTKSPPYMGNLGYLSSGIEIFFPLTPKLCLSLNDIGQHRIVPSEKMIMHNTENVIYQNHIVFDWSHRHVFSNEENFDLAEKILKEYPLTNKSKVEIADGKNAKNKR